MKNNFTKIFVIYLFAGMFPVLTFSGCGIYRAIDDRLHPTPQIDEEVVDYQINRYSDGRLSVDFTVSVVDGDVAMFYYSCRTDDGWDSDQQVGSQRVVDGEAQNFHITLCDTKLMVQVVVYNNFRKRSQRHNEMAWLFDIEKANPLF